LIALALLCLLGQSAAQSAVLGLVTDTAEQRVTVFDADSDLVSQQMAATPGNANGDCAVSGPASLGIASNSSSQLSFIDLSAAGAAPAPLEISNLGVDMALSPDGNFLVIAGGGALQQPLSVVDLRQQTEISTSRHFVDHSSVEFCDDATLLITTLRGRQYHGTRDNALYSAGLGFEGEIELDGARLQVGAQPNNSACAPGSRSGVVLDRDGGITSFTLPGLQAAERQHTLGGMGLSAAFDTAGRRLYVRTEAGVEAFDFDPDTGAMQRAWSQPAPTPTTYYGIEQLVVHPSGDKLYVDGGRELLVLSSADGATLSTIAAGDATGVCLAVVERGLEYIAGGAEVAGVAAP